MIAVVSRHGPRHAINSECVIYNSASLGSILATQQLRSK